MIAEIYFDPDSYENQEKKDAFFSLVKKYYGFEETLIFNEVSLIINFNYYPEVPRSYYEPGELASIEIESIDEVSFNFIDKIVPLTKEQSKEFVKELNELGWLSDDEIETKLWEVLECSQEDY